MQKPSQKFEKRTFPACDSEAIFSAASAFFKAEAIDVVLAVSFFWLVV
jgi:hypothetical protein